jgi:uncharacterized protein
VRPPWGFADVLISVAVLLGVSIVGGLALVAGLTVFSSDDVADRLADPDATTTAVLVGITWLGFLAWPAVVSRTKGEGSFRADFGLWFRPIDMAWAVGGLLMIYGVLIVGVQAYSLLTGGGEPPTNVDMVDAASASPGSLLVLLLFVGIGTPIVEEIWFRGFLLRAIGWQWGTPAAVVSSSFIFGLFHVFGFAGWGALWIVGLLSLFGVVFALLTVKTEGRLGAAIICHALNNSITVLVVAA